MTEEFNYRTQGTCAQLINIKVNGNTVEEVRFMGGCPGNTVGVAKLVQGRTLDEVISTLEGIRCGNKPTSCPDQLAKALKEIKARRQ